MYAIREFCKKRKTGRKIEDAFVAYCKASVSDYFNIISGATATGLLAKFTEQEIDELWGKFIVDLKATILEEEHPDTQKPS